MLAGEPARTQEVAVDDEFDLSPYSFWSCGLSADEIRELLLIVDEVVARRAVSHVQIADDDCNALLTHSSLRRLDIKWTLQRIPQAQGVVFLKQLTAKSEQDVAHGVAVRVGRKKSLGEHGRK